MIHGHIRQLIIDPPKVSKQLTITLHNDNSAFDTPL